MRGDIATSRAGSTKRPAGSGLTRVRAEGVSVRVASNAGDHIRRWGRFPGDVALEGERNVNELPTREEIQRAISQWWRGGGTTNHIIDVCRRDEATITEVKAVAQRLSERADKGLQFISREIVGETLEMVRASAAHQEGRSETLKAHLKSPSGKSYPGLAWHPSKGWVHLAGYPPKAWLEAGGFEAAGGEPTRHAAADSTAGLHSPPASSLEKK